MRGIIIDAGELLTGVVGRGEVYDGIFAQLWMRIWLRAAVVICSQLACTYLPSLVDMMGWYDGI